MPPLTRRLRPAPGTAPLPAPVPFPAPVSPLPGSGPSKECHAIRNRLIDSVKRLDSALDQLARLGGLAALLAAFTQKTNARLIETLETAWEDLGSALEELDPPDSLDDRTPVVEEART